MWSFLFRHTRTGREITAKAWEQRKTIAELERICEDQSREIALLFDMLKAAYSNPETIQKISERAYVWRALQRHRWATQSQEADTP